MTMIPIHAIAFFLATLLLPADVDQFTVDVQGKTIQWTRQNADWHGVELPIHDLGIYSLADSVVAVSVEGREEKTDVNSFLAIPADGKTTTILEVPTARESFGTPIRVRRERNKITLSQAKGVFFEKPAIISWTIPKTSAVRTTP